MSRMQLRHVLASVLQELHWLPVALIIHFKILLLALKSIQNGFAPSYLSELLYNHVFLLDHYAPPINPYLFLLNVILGRTDTEQFRLLLQF